MMDKLIFFVNLQKGNSMNLQRFFISFLLLLSTTIIYILVEWQDNVDVRSAYPILLMICSFLYAFYAFILLNIDKINPQKISFFLFFNIMVSFVVLSLHLTFAFYYFDFYVINEDIEPLIWYEKIITSGWTLPIILIISLCCYALKVKLSTKEKP